MTVEQLETYLVGGAVRDELLGIEVKEKDWVVVGSTPEEMLSLGFTQVGKDFPVYLHPKSGEEYALARTERKKGHGYGGFEVHASPDITLEQDLQRRDLTINAIAKDSAGQLIDPYGGRQDIEARKLRHVSDAFSEDPLRVFRAARFAARFARFGFEIAPDTFALMTKLSHNGELQYLAAERIWVELDKTLQSESPSVFFQMLEDCGAIAGLSPLWHPNKRELKALDTAAAAKLEPPLQMAALLAHQALDSVEQVVENFKLPKQYRELAQLVARHGIDCHCRTGEHALTLLENCDAWRRQLRFEQFLQVCRITYALQEDEEQRLLAAAEKTLAVDTTEWQAEGIKGAAIGERVRQERLQRLVAIFGS